MSQKIIAEIIRYGCIADWNITIEDVEERYKNAITNYGQDKADEGLSNTLKQVKSQAKEVDKRFWQSVKGEVFSKSGCCPSAIRDLKNMIKDKEISIEGFNNEQTIKERLEMI